MPSLPRTLRGQARWESRCQAPVNSPSISRGSHAGWKLWPRTGPTGPYSSLPRAGTESRGLSLESRGLGLGPPELAILSACHSTRQCQIHGADLQEPMEVGRAAVSLSLSLAPSLPIRHGAPGTVEGAPGWPGAHSSAVPRGSCSGAELGVQVFLISAGPGSECTVGAPGQGPRYLDSSPSRYSRATS